MSDRTPEGPSDYGKGFNYFILAVAIGVIVGTLIPLLLEYLGVIDYVKDWP